MTYSANLSFFATKTNASGAINSGIDGVPIGANTASTGKFTSVTNTGLTSGRVTYAGTSGLLSDSANFTFSGTDLILGAANPNFQGSSSTGSAALINNSGGAFVRVYGGSHATRANYTDFINASSTSTFDSGGTLSLGSQILLSNNNYIGFKNNGASVTASIFQDTSNFLNLYNSGNTGTIFYVNAGERLRLTNTSLYTASGVNVGIGNSNPTAKLDISTSDTADTIGIRRSTNATNGMLKFTTAGTDDWILGQRNTSDSDFHLYNYGTSSDVLKVLRSNGYVGIGTSSPSQTLSVSQTTLITSTAGGVSQLLFGDNASDFAGRLFYNHGNDNLQFFVNSAERMRITETGLVGIGTSSPNAKLQVTTSSFPVLKVADEIGGGAIALGDAAISSNYVGIWRGAANSISGGGFLNVQGNNIAFMSTDAVFGSATRTMTLTNTGNLGVGVTSPDARIDVQVSSGAGYRAYKTTVGGFNALNFYTVNENVIGTIGVTSTNDVFYLGYGTTPVLTWNGSGNVGIGTSSPSAPLTVKGLISSTSTPVLYLQQGGSSPNYGYRFNIDNVTTGNLYLNRLDGNTNTDIGSLITIRPDGNLGIGVSNPTSKLSVYGDIIVTRNAVIGINGDSVAAGTFAFRNSSGVQKSAIASYYNIGDEGNIEFLNGTTTSMVLSSAGRLAFGGTSTTTAKVRFELTSLGTLGSVVNVASFGTNGIFSLGGVAGNSDGLYFGTGSSSGDSVASGFGFLREAGGWNSAIAFYTNNVTSGPYGVSAMQEKMRLTSGGTFAVGQTGTTNGLGVTLQPNLATAAVGYSGSFATVWNIPTGTCGLFTVHMGGNGQYGGAILFFVTYGGYAPGGNAVVTPLTARQGDQSGYSWSWQIAANGQFQMRNDTNTVAFVPVIAMVTLG